MPSIGPTVIEIQYDELARNMNPTGKGGFKKGVSGNPKGRASVWQGFNERVLFLLNDMTYGELVDIIENEEIGKKLATRDYIILRSIYAACTAEDALSAEYILNRIYGKPHCARCLSKPKK